MVKVTNTWYNIGDVVQIIRNVTGHRFNLGDEVKIFRFIGDGFAVDACHQKTGDCSVITAMEFDKTKSQQTMKLMKDAVRDTANKLCKANNTVTTLEIKTELRKTHPYFHWIQNSRNGLTGVSEYMDELHNDGEFTYTDNGNYRVYSAVTTAKPVSTPNPKPTKAPVKRGNRISRKQALDLMVNNKGHFFTAVFVKQNGDERKMNCQYMKIQTPAPDPDGYVKVREAIKMKQGDNPIRQINMLTLSTLRIGGVDYKIK